MDKDTMIQALQLTYAGVIADATCQLGREGVLDNVVARKRREQLEQGGQKAARFGITSPEQVFTALSSLFRCANWKIERRDAGFVAVTKSCLLCGLTKQLSGPSPCRLYCLDPMEGMVKGVAPQAEFDVQETLWDGSQCAVRVSGPTMGGDAA